MSQSKAPARASDFSSHPKLGESPRRPRRQSRCFRIRAGGPSAWIHDDPIASGVGLAVNSSEVIPLAVNPARNSTAIRLAPASVLPPFVMRTTFTACPRISVERSDSTIGLRTRGQDSPVRVCGCWTRPDCPSQASAPARSKHVPWHVRDV